MGTSLIDRKAPRRPERLAAVYWRRRFITLVLGLAVLAVTTWGITAALGGTAPGSAHRAGVAVAASAAARRHPKSPTPTVRPSPTASARHPTRTSSGSPDRHSGQQGCAFGDVVLSLFADQASYSASQMPEFQVDVVSTASHPCTFDIGAKHVILQISSSASRVWTSAECAEGQASLVTKLQRGVPTVVPIAWNGERSSPGCPVPGARAPAGSYTAVATDGTLISNAVSFRWS